MSYFDYFVNMASGRSPPGRPGFKIHPLKPLDEVPSGRREMWLTRHDSKHHFKLWKINAVINSSIISNTVTNIQYYEICVACLYIIKIQIGGHRAHA